MKNRVAGSSHHLVPRPIPSLFSIVIPIYNEEEVIPLLLERLRKIKLEIGVPVEIILVNDGSSDQSLCLLLDAAQNDPSVNIISLSRNFGHQMACTAGLDLARGDAVVLMDGDLQDPPELIPEMLKEYRKGFDVVYAQRTGRERETVFKRTSAWLFYRFICALVRKDLPMDAGEFRLISRQCLNALKSMRELHRFIRGMVVWVGFSQTAVKFIRPARAGGSTKYSVRRMLRLAWDATVSFSLFPLRLSLGFGSLLAMLGVLYGCNIVITAGFGGFVTHAWASLIIIHCIVGGMILICIGVMGEYIGRIFEESKGRPLYVINHEATERRDRNAPVDEHTKQARMEKPC